MSINKFVECPGCGSLVMNISEPAHKYIGAVAGCWNIYGKVLGKEFGTNIQPVVQRRIVDAYAVQHPGNESPLTTQSVAVHLLGLYFIVEKQFDLDTTNNLIKRALLQKDKFYWLNPPQKRGKTTITDIYKSKTFEEHEKLVDEWAGEVWEAWSEHHQVIKNWAENII